MDKRARIIVSGMKAWGIVFFLCLTGQQTVEAQRPVSNVVVETVIEQSVAAGQTFVGTTTPVKKSMVGSAVDGRVADYPINEGDFVKKNQPLAQLRTATIELELEAAKDELKLRKEELNELENGSRPAEIRQAKAAMLAAKTAMEYHQNKKNRAEELYRSNAINADELQLIVSEQIQAEQKYLQAKESYQLVVDGPRKERIEQARAQVAIQQSIVEKLQDQLSKHTIKAPFDGFISAEHTEVGQWVQRGELVAEVLALNEIDVLSQVPESVIPFVKRGMQVNVRIAALPEHLFTGELVSIVPQADVRSRTFPVKIRVRNGIENDIPLIKSGMIARVTLPTGAKTKSLFVPKDALVLGGRTTMIYVVATGEKKGTFVAKPVAVETGIAMGERIQVIGNLQPGQQVIIRGNERLRPGQPVTILKTNQ